MEYKEQLNEDVINLLCSIKMDQKVGCSVWAPEDEIELFESLEKYINHNKK